MANDEDWDAAGALANHADERMHPVGDDAAWSESYYFNFIDPDSKVAMFTRMGFRPGDGWADGLHVVYLGGDRVAFTYARREIGQDLGKYDADLSVGGLELVCHKPFERWQIRYQGQAQDIADSAILLERRKARPEGWYREGLLAMRVDFDALAAPHYASSGPRGHFEQTGRVRGTIALSGEQFVVNGFGVRDKSWGPRDWGASSTRSNDRQASGGQKSPAPFVNWFSMNFGSALALGGSCFRTREGRLRGNGWIQRNGDTQELLDVEITSEYRAQTIWHTAVHLTGRAADGESVSVRGRMLTVCPTKIPTHGGAIFVNEGLAQFESAGLIGYGISEHWHAVGA